VPNLIDRVAAVAAMLAEPDGRRDEQVLIMLPDGPGCSPVSQWFRERWQTGPDGGRRWQKHDRH
jgi:hypothetical protein